MTGTLHQQSEIVQGVRVAQSSHRSDHLACSVSEVSDSTLLLSAGSFLGRRYRERESDSGDEGGVHLTPANIHSS